jgi:hypothetical protein
LNRWHYFLLFLGCAQCSFSALLFYTFLNIHDDYQRRDRRI